jgi:hypothetical protein
MQADGHFDDHPERPQRPCEELAEVVARHVLDHLAARARDGPVRKRHRHAEDEVARRAVAMTARARVPRGDDAAHRRPVVLAERRVQREHLPGRREALLRRRHREPRTQDRRQVALVVLHQRIET